jgi:pilus assembly protein CpaB
MNKRILSVLAFAVAVSAIATFALYRLISASLVASAKPTTVAMTVAARNLDVGALIKETDLRTVETAGKVPTGAIFDPAHAVGRGVVASIYEGEPILEARLAPIGAGAGLAATIPPGMRAVAVRVNEVVGVAGFVSPGQHVDVLISGNPPGGASANLGALTRTLLQNIPVLSAGQNIQKDPEGKPVTVQVVNLLVSPEQAEILSLASNETRIQLVLRNPLDTATVKTPGTAIAHLFSGQTGNLPMGASGNPAARPASPPPAQRRPVAATLPPPPPQPPPPTVEPQKVIVPITVEVYTGSRRADTRFAPPPKEEKP